jgi:protein-S-isoprenylcysteine O-methyltransferase Ste14
MRWLELKVPPPVVWLVFAAAMLGVTHMAPTLTFPIPGRVTVALLVSALGAAMGVAGVIAFRSKRTTVNPLTPSASSALVSGGIYRFSRNPMYLGLLLVLAGWALYLSNVAAAMLLPVFSAYMTRYQIKPEERALSAKFGPEFAQYMAQVRRWI